MLHELPASYPYKPKKWTSIAASILFSLATYVLIEQAKTNERGLELIFFRHVLELSFTEHQATIFYWILSSLSGFLALLGLLNLLYSFFALKSEIILTDKEIAIPANIFHFNKSVIIPYNEVFSLKLYEIQGIRSLTIIHQKGKKYISEACLPQKIMFDEITNFLNYRLS